MSTFASERVRELLAEHYVAVAVDTDFSERRREGDALEAFFDLVVEQRDPQKFIGCAPSPLQGYYIFDHTGELYDAASFIHVNQRKLPGQHQHSVRERDVSLLIEMLEAGAARFAERPPEGDGYEPEGPREVVYPPLPDDVVVLRSWTQIKPLPKGVQHELNSLTGRDTLWARHSELRELAEGRFPLALARRLALGNLRDNVRGAARTFKLEHLERLAFSATPRRRAAGWVEVSLAGDVLISAPENSRVRPLPAMGYEGKLTGTVLMRLPSCEVISWQMFAKGVAWGNYPNTPGAPEGRYPLQVGFRLAAPDDRLARLLPPLGATGDRQKYLEQGISTRVAGIDDD